MKIMKDHTKLKKEADLLKALGHPIRLCIVAGLLGRECNVSTMQECIKLPQPVISQHLAVLKFKKIISGERSGQEVIYKVVDERAKKIIENILLKEE